MIFFDLDETLLDFKGAEYLGVMAFYEKYGHVFHLEKDAFYNHWCNISAKHFKRFLSGHLSFDQQKVKRITEIFKAADIAITETEATALFEFYLASFKANWKPFDDVIPCLEILKENRLGVLTNGDAKQQRQKLEKLGIAKYFEWVITSGDIGFAKPDLRFFEIACKKTNTSPNECLFISDDLEVDILPCQKMNMRGIWLNRKNKPLIHPTVESITALSELKRFLA